VEQSWKTRRPSRYAVVLFGASAIAAGALSAAAPALATRTTGPPRTLPGFRVAPNLSVLPALGRRALTVTKSKELFGVFCNSPTDCWAVGEIFGNHRTTNQVLHWTGKKWFPVTVPNPAGTGSGALDELFAVRCTSARNCWAVGDSQKKSGAAVLDQVQHFNGTKWSVTPASSPGGTAPGNLNSLDDVACTSARSCWAAGDYGLQGTGPEPQVLFNQTLHFDGTKWTFVKTPNPAGHSTGDFNALLSVRCTGPNDCWAAGTGGNIIMSTLNIKFRLHNAMLHWNGKKWAQVTVPAPAVTGKSVLNELNTLACTAPKNCWAVGISAKIANLPKGFQHNEALHWTGKKWTFVPTPNPGGKVNDLLGVTCTAPSNCWAVGGAGSDPGLNEALHWNSKKWSVVHTPNAGGTGMAAINSLSSVRCTSPSNCWAVGDSELGNSVDINQILHWNGTKWVTS
jgi:hypothetical protein